MSGERTRRSALLGGPIACGRADVHAAHGRGAFYGAVAGIALAAEASWRGQPLAPWVLATPSAVELALARSVMTSVTLRGRFVASDLLERVATWRGDPRLDGATRGALALLALEVPGEDIGRLLWEAGYRAVVPGGALLRTLPIGLAFAGMDGPLLEASLGAAGLRAFDPWHRLLTVAFNAMIAAAARDRETPEGMLDRADHALRAALRRLTASTRDPAEAEAVRAAVADLRGDLNAIRIGAAPWREAPEGATQPPERGAFLRAVWHLLHTPSLAVALIQLAGRGAAAPLTGALLGAAYGEEALPRAWREAVERDAARLLEPLLRPL